MISTDVISLQSPCNPIAFYRTSARNLPSPRILIFGRWKLEIVSAMAFGLFRVDLVSRLVSVWPWIHMVLPLPQNFLKCRKRKPKWALETLEKKRTWQIGVKFFDLTRFLFVYLAASSPVSPWPYLGFIKLNMQPLIARWKQRESPVALGLRLQIHGPDFFFFSLNHWPMTSSNWIILSDPSLPFSSKIDEDLVESLELNYWQIEQKIRPNS